MISRYLSYSMLGLAALCLVLSGCIFNAAPPADATEAANVAAESMFMAFNTGDYGRFSAGFSPQMKAGVNESSFSTMRAQILDKYGNYTSKSAPQASVVQGYNNFVYDCQFAKGTLKIRLVMNATNASTVQGLWFPGGI